MIVVTGAAGFIGFHVAQRLLARGDDVLGIDNLNEYYDPSLKRARLAILQQSPRFRFELADIADRDIFPRLLARERPSRIVHLAAQAGVRYSLEAPYAYTDSNVTGFLNVLEAARNIGVEHLVYASSSSVYGMNEKQPFAEEDRTDHPVSLYAATKKANEAMAHAYAHLFAIPSTGLRFFTVYGPWGRPDMALFSFTRRILDGQPIPVFNEGQMIRDFTYIDDVTEAVVRVLDVPPAAHRIFNVGNGSPTILLRYIEVLEQALGIHAKKEMLPLQPGDVLVTNADVSALEREFGWRPSTPIEAGVQRFVDWYLDYYNERIRTHETASSDHHHSYQHHVRGV